MDPRPSLSTTERVRLFKLHKGRCHICGLKIDGTRELWEVEHIIPRSMIGKAADTDENMQPAHVDCHKQKTAQDSGNLARAKRREARHIGAHVSDTPMPFGRRSGLKKRMDGTIVDRRTGEVVRKGRA